MFLQIKTGPYKVLSISVCILCFCSATLQSQIIGDSDPDPSKTIELDALVVQASRLDAENLAIFSAESINPNGFEQLSGTLQRATGVYINAPLALSGISELILRGGEANFTKVQIEGIEINNPMDTRGGGVAISTLDGLPFSTIEITKGAASSLLGSGAISGVLSLQLGEQLQDVQNALEFEFGDFGYQRIAATGLLANQTKSYGIQAGLNRIEEDSRYEGHDFVAEGGFAKATYENKNGTQVSLSFWSLDSEQHRLPEDSGGLLYAASQEMDSISANLSAISLRFGQVMPNDSLLVLQLGQFSHDQLSISPGVAAGERNPYGVPANRFDDAFERNQIELSYRMSGIEKLQFALGASMHQERGKSVGSVEIFPGFSLPGAYDVERDLVSIFAEGALTLSEKHIFHLAERMDKVSAQSAEWSGSINYLFKPEHLGADFSISYAEAFKAPSLFALNNALVGNPELESETSKTWEIGIAGSIQANHLFHWSASVFTQDYDNLIDLAEATQQMTNLSGVKMNGAEFALTTNLHETLSLRLSGSLLDIDLKDTEEILRFRPESIWALELIKSVGERHAFRVRYQMTGNAGIHRFRPGM